MTRNANLRAWRVAMGLFAGVTVAWGQNGANDAHQWPDELVLIEASGTVLVQMLPGQEQYFLDTNADSRRDYHLSFGPPWYQPATEAVRPQAGDFITVLGALQDGELSDTILVFEINGLVWRTAVECGAAGYNAEPCWDIGGDLVTVDGTVMVDETYFYPHFYLDTDDDAQPDLKLGLGPPWYEPASGATRPADGDRVSVVGRLHELDGLDLLTVFELDGAYWRDVGGPAPWSGSWVRGQVDEDQTVRSANNETSWIRFQKGFMGQHQGGGSGGNVTSGSGHQGSPSGAGNGVGWRGGEPEGNMAGLMAWPDSIFVGFWELPPDSLPGPPLDGAVLGYHVAIREPNGNSIMDGRFGGQRLRIRFEHEVQIRFSYLDADVGRQNREEATLRLRSWNAETKQWSDPTESAVLVPEENALVYASMDVEGYYALVALPLSTGTAPVDEATPPQTLRLLAAFPNPFNPSTTLPFELARPERVSLEVVDAMGRPILRADLGLRHAGRHEISLRADGWASGPYLVRLRSPSTYQTGLLVLER